MTGGESLERVRRICGQPDGNRKRAGAGSRAAGGDRRSVDEYIDACARLSGAGHRECCLRGERRRRQRRPRGRREAEHAAGIAIGDVEVPRHVEGEPLGLGKVFREQSDVGVRMELRHRPSGSIGGEGDLFGREVERAEAVARQAQRFRELIARADSLRRARGAAGQDRDLEDDAVGPRITSEPGSRCVERLVVDGDALQLAEAACEDRERAARGEGQHHLRLGGLVVRLEIGAAGDEVARAHVERAVFADGEPPRLLDAGHERRQRVVCFHTSHASGPLLGDEQSTAWVERQADGALEAGGHGNTRTVGGDSPHDATCAVGDEHVARGIDHDAANVHEAVGQCLEGRERADRLLGRRTRREPGEREDQSDEGACHRLYGARRRRSISSRLSGRAPSTVVTCCDTPSSSTIRSHR